MLPVNSYDRHVAASLLDYMGAKAPWQRRLWGVGTVMGLREVLEGSEAVQSGVLSSGAFENLCHAVETVACQDPGTGVSEERRLLQKCLRSCPRFGSSDYLIINQFLSEIEEKYLSRWKQTLLNLAEKDQQPSVDLAARSIATHLLDLGFSQVYMHPWWTFRIEHEPGLRLLADLVDDAAELIRQTPADFEVLIPFLSTPGMGSDEPPHWKSPTAVSHWLREHGFDPRDLRQTGGLLLPVKARDVYAAVEQAFEIIERLSTRVNLGTSSQLQPAPEAWVRNYQKAFQFRRTERGVEISALLRENQLYTASPTSNIDAALELLGSLNEGPPGPAVASGWAAIEALLLGPGDGKDRGSAGESLAALIACSYPRAELTALAHAHMKEADDRLAEQLKVAETSRERVALIANALKNQQKLALSSESDQLAETRMKALLVNPKSSLKQIEDSACRTLRRMYRQRNLILHWGRMNAVCLRAALRTAAPLVGAGIDRIAHFWFTNKTNPLELAARARIRLELLETSASHEVFGLLDS